VSTERVALPDQFVADGTAFNLEDLNTECERLSKDADGISCPYNTAHYNKRYGIRRRQETRLDLPRVSGQVGLHGGASIFEALDIKDRCGNRSSP
jgi:hypothetical protein